MNENEHPDILHDDAVAEPDGAAAEGAIGTWRPADYYAAPPAKSKFPRWVPLTAGAVAILALVLMFAIGAFLRAGGLSSFVALAIGQFQGELKGMLDESVDADAKERLDAALRDVRERLTNGSLDLPAALPLLEEIQKVTRDRKVTAEEIEALQSIVGGIANEETPPAEPVEL